VARARRRARRLPVDCVSTVAGWRAPSPTVRGQYRIGGLEARAHLFPFHPRGSEPRGHLAADCRDDYTNRHGRAMLLAAAAASPWQRARAGARRRRLRHEVALAAPGAARVSLAPHLTELMYAAGAGERMAGALDYSDYPPARARCSRVGSETSIDLEALVRCARTWWSPAQCRQRARGGAHRALGIPVFRSEPGSWRTSRARSRRSGARRHAGRRARRRGPFAIARRASPPSFRPFQGARLLQVWDRPLITVSGRSRDQQGDPPVRGENVMADLRASAGDRPRAVLRADPQVIVATAWTARARVVDDWRAFPGWPPWRGGQSARHPTGTAAATYPRLLDGPTHVQILEGARRQKAR